MGSILDNSLISNYDLCVWLHFIVLPADCLCMNMAVFVDRASIRCFNLQDDDEPLQVRLIHYVD